MDVRELRCVKCGRGGCTYYRESGFVECKWCDFTFDLPPNIKVSENGAVLFGTEQQAEKEPTQPVVQTNVTTHGGGNTATMLAWQYVDKDADVVPLPQGYCRMAEEREENITVGQAMNSAKPGELVEVMLVPVPQEDEDDPDGLERPEIEQERLEELGRQLLVELGEDPDREGLKDTPRRWAKSWKEFFEHDPGSMGTVFQAEGIDQMVVVSGIRVWSFCEHHLLPFWADVSIGYIADKKIIGLSKLARIAHHHAHGLQVQERLAKEVAEHLKSLVQTDDVAVHIRGWHTCMMMRGAKTVAPMDTSVALGKFRDHHAVRAEFFSMIAPASERGV